MSNNQTQSQNTQAPTGPDNKQLNKLPLVICAVIVAAFMLLVITSFSEEDKKQDTETEKTRQTTTTNTAASMVNIKEQADFIKKRKELEKKEKEDSAHTVDQPISNKFEDRPKKIAPISQEQIEANKKQIDPRFEEFAQMRKNKFKEALYANTKASSYSNFKKSNSNLRPVSNSSLPANASYEEKMKAYNDQISQLNNYQNDITQGFNQKKQIQGMLSNLQNLTGMNLTSSNNNLISNSNYASSRNTNNVDKWKLKNELEETSDFILNTGFVIPGVLISGINSDLPGRIIAQVSQNVYDTKTGRYLLIPQGTKVFGIYKSEIKFGQERVMVAWNRLIYPDGKTYDIGDMSGADMAGYAGFTDQVNNHYWKLFKGALLLSFVTAGVTYTDNKYNTGNGEENSATSAMAESLGQELGQVSVELIRKHMNVSPTLEIRPGYRFNIIVTKDISFTKPYALFK